MTADPDMIRLQNLRKRLWERIRAGDADAEVARLIEELNKTTDAVLARRKT